MCARQKTAYLPASHWRAAAFPPSGQHRLLPALLRRPWRTDGQLLARVRELQWWHSQRPMLRLSRHWPLRQSTETLPRQVAPEGFRSLAAAARPRRVGRYECVAWMHRRWVAAGVEQTRLTGLNNQGGENKRGLFSLIGTLRADHFPKLRLIETGMGSS
jgi:hypothetical protein